MDIYDHMVHLRAIEKSDLEFLRSFLNDPGTEAMTGGSSFPVSKYAQEKWFEQFDFQKELRCIVEIEGIAVGTAGLVHIDWRNRSGSIYYKMSNDLEHRKKGDLQAAIHGILRYAFEEMNLNCVYGYILKKNVMSRKAIVRAGFVKEGVLRERVYKQGEFQDQEIYSILKSEFCK